MDRVDESLRLIRDARDLPIFELSYRHRVFHQDDWQTKRLEDSDDNLTTVIEDLNGLPPSEEPADTEVDPGDDYDIYGGTNWSPYEDQDSDW
jgi:hypothetical protein